jgi:hypothetical protein
MHKKDQQALDLQLWVELRGFEPPDPLDANEVAVGSNRHTAKSVI